MKIALAGNPNSGKTTLFNELTGSNQYVGNWPGVTVEKKDGELRNHKDVTIQDLPGIYSLSPYSLEERVARNFLVNEKPDAILNIVDGTNIERNLYLTTQLVEIGLPMVVTVNMMDLVERDGDKIDFEKLGKFLNCKVVGISAQKGWGGLDAAECAIRLVEAGETEEPPHVFTGSVEHALAHIEESLQGRVPEASMRWYAIKVFERDKEAIAALQLDHEILRHVEQHIVDCERELDDDAEAIIVAQRYDFIQKMIDKCVVRGRRRSGGLTLSDKIDRVVTNRILAIPVFLLALFAMYWLAVSAKGPGTVLTDWANDCLLGEGWFLPATRHVYTSPAGTAAKPWFEGMNFEAAREAFAPYGESVAKWEAAYKTAYDGKHGKGQYDAALAAFNAQARAAAKPGEPFEAARFAVLDEPLAETVKTEAWLENEETGEILKGKVAVTEGRIAVERCGCEACACTDDAGVKPAEGSCACCDGDVKWPCDYALYRVAKGMAEPDPAKGFGVWIPGFKTVVGRWVERAGITGIAAALINNGLIGGVCTVLGFIPVITIIFLFLAFLEDCGYMARIAFIMDRLFRGFGLSGKSFIPMLVGKGCGVPAVMAARTIENKRDQRMTIILATFIPCGAKTVLITMFTAAFFRDVWFVAPLMDVIGVAIIVLGGLALKKSRFFAGEAASFVMELPAYHLPTLQGIWIRTWDRVKAYAIKAGTVIFAACVILTLMMTFDWRFNVLEAERIGESILASIGNAIAWVFAPLGFGTWEGATASLTAEIAKEQATATLAMVAGGDGSTIRNVTDLFATFSGYPKLSALAFLVFNLFMPPCLVAIVTAFKEMGETKWGCFALAFQLFVGYFLALNVFQIGSWIEGGAFGIWTVAALLLDLAVLYFIFRPASARTAARQLP